jgi:hypothetical protein
MLRWVAKSQMWGGCVVILSSAPFFESVWQSPYFSFLFRLPFSKIGFRSAAKRWIIALYSSFLFCKK